ncbi:MAG: SRPBCC family protein [Bacteroidota bacterium]|nr:SRPBCC family protein [Bacteroidota bacterium]
MGVIKLGFISLIVFALLITGFSLFIPSHIRISKATDINASQDSVLQQLNNPSHWKQWYPGADTLDLYTENGQLKGISTGNGQSLKIISVNDSTITTAMVGPGAKKGSSGWNIYQGRTPNTVTVQWYMDIHLRWYPWEKFSSLLLEKRYGPMMEQGLEKLKDLLEKQVKP